MSFLTDRVCFDGLTFDDVLLVPSYSEVLPKDVILKTRFTKKITLNLPFVSAAMDTVTEAKMAISMAREGGIGVIHKNMSIEDQAAQVYSVKRAENGMINAPVTIRPNMTVKDAQKLMADYKIGGIPVIDGENHLIGIITNRDLRFEKNMDKLVEEIMTKDNLITTNRETGLAEAEEILQLHKIEKLPVVDDKGHLVGLITYKDITKAKDKPYACKDSNGRLCVAAGVGISADMMDRVSALVNAGVDAVVLDSAHGHSKGVIEALKKIKSTYPNLEVVVGNIATAEAAVALADAGADAVKVGMGPGSICTTRIIAGIGVPQLSAVYQVYKALEGRDVPIIADGGIRFSGDIVKALAAGYNGRKFKAYRGMGSLEAMQRGSKDRYMQSDVSDAKKLVPEGISGRVPYKGDLYEVIYQMSGGLRSGMGYCGALTIKELHNAKFCRITPAGVTENHPHDVTIISEAPNYSPGK